MISLEDCIGLCGLTEEEVLAIAEHEHLPEIAAAALAAYLLHQAHGTETVRDMIVDDIRKAQGAGPRRPGARVDVVACAAPLSQNTPRSRAG
jgi:DNA repair protein RadC